LLWGFICDKLAESKDAPDWKVYEATAHGGAKQIAKAVMREKNDLRKDASLRRQFNAIANLDAVLKSTCWFGYVDLKHLVNNVLKIKPGDTWKDVGDGLLSGSKGVQPAVKLNAYLARFNGLTRNEQAPSEELALLVYLVGECDERIHPTDVPVLQNMFALKSLEEMLDELPVSNPEVRNIVRRAFLQAGASMHEPASDENGMRPRQRPRKPS
jgi:hypothetical protein